MSALPKAYSTLADRRDIDGLMDALPRAPAAHRKALIEAVFSIYQDIAMALAEGKLRWPRADLLFDRVARTLDRWWDPLDFEIRWDIRLMTLGMFPQAPRLLRRKRAAVLRSLADRWFARRPRDPAVLRNRAEALWQQYRVDRNKASLRRLLDFHRKTTAARGPDAFWTQWLSHLSRAARGMPAAHRPILKMGENDFCRSAGREWSAGRLNPFILAEAFHELAHGADVPPGWRAERRFWLDRCLSLWPTDAETPQTLDRRGDVFRRAYEHYKDVRYLIGALGCYQKQWEKSPEGALYSLIRTKTALAEGVRPVSENQYRRMILEQWPAVEKTARRPAAASLPLNLRPAASFSKWNSAVEFLEKNREVLLAEDPATPWDRRRYEMSLAAEKAGEGYYGTPYRNLVDAGARLGRWAEAEAWMIRFFLRHTIVVDGDFRAFARAPWARKRAPLGRTLRSILEYYEKFPSSYYDGGRPVDRLRRLSLPRLRQALRDALDKARAAKNRSRP